jgi:adenylyl-sulfate kinase
MAADKGSTNIVWHRGEVTPERRAAALGHKGATLWFTGLSGSGKSTVAVALERQLLDRGVNAYRLDGDNIRHHLNSDLSFSPEDRKENIRRIGEVSRLFADAGVVTLVSFISPYRADRDSARAMHDEASLTFFEVFVDTPIEVCEQRDPKGLYKKARAGEIADFTGISAPYEPPESPELRLTPADGEPDEQAAKCILMLTDRGVLPAIDRPGTDAAPDS